MIYTASYFWENQHHGKLISISSTVPQGFKVDGQLGFFIPSEYLINRWKKKLIDREEYTSLYRQQCKEQLGHIKLWLNTLKPEEDQTLLCYELPNDFCHRNLAIKLVQHHRPDCYGGCDVLNKEEPEQRFSTWKTNNDWKKELQGLSNDSRERIDFYLRQQAERGWKLAAAWKPTENDHQKGYIQLSYEDLEYIARKLGYKPGWVRIKAYELGINKKFVSAPLFVSD